MTIDNLKEELTVIFAKATPPSTAIYDSQLYRDVLRQLYDDVVEFCWYMYTEY